MVVWWYILYALIAIVAIGTFLPNDIGGGLDNIPLLIVLVSILVIVWIVKFIRYVMIFFKAKRHLVKNGYKIIQTNILPPRFCKNKYNIVAKKNDVIINILVLKIKKSYLTYHFESINSIELYKHTRLTIKPRVGQANIISGYVEKKKIGTIPLYWKSNDLGNKTNIVLFDKFPNEVKDTKHQENLGNEDKVLDKFYIYDLKDFQRKSF